VPLTINPGDSVGVSIAEQGTSTWLSFDDATAVKNGQTVSLSAAGATASA
jgi:hypothetical protein